MRSRLSPEIMDALEMPRRGLRQWFARVERFCRKHGGERRYRELLELMARCQQALDDEERRRGGGR